jgi:hypothetical protein
MLVVRCMPKAKPCPHNPDKCCDECKKERRKEYVRNDYEKHAEERREAKRQAYADDPEKFQERVKEWREQPGNKKKRNAWEQERRDEDPEAAAAYLKTWREKNPEKEQKHKLRNNEWRREDRAKNPQKYLEKDRARAGIVWAPGQSFESLLTFQNGFCAGNCGRNLREMDSKQVHVDHDHDIVGTPNVRGIVCHRCNMAIGLAGDRLENILNLMKYLTNPPGRKNNLDQNPRP